MLLKIALVLFNKDENIQIAEMLEEHGWDVTRCFNSVSDALERLDKREVDVMVCSFAHQADSVLKVAEAVQTTKMLDNKYKLYLDLDGNMKQKLLNTISAAYMINRKILVNELTRIEKKLEG